MKIKLNTKNENLKRLNQIYKVLKKNDFGYLIEESTIIKKFPFLKSSNKETKRQLDDSIPIRVRKVFEELGPAYIKLGQMLSTRPDLVGWDIANELANLRDNTPETPFEEIKQVIEEELERPIEEVFKDIDRIPLGSASIGQVHKGVLLSNNKEVAIKVQKPHIHKIIKSDVKIMKFIAENIDKYMQKTQIYNLPSIVYEFERSIIKEINYKDELLNMEHLAYNFKKMNNIHIPYTYPEYSSEKLITMELIKGEEVSKIFDNDDPKYDKKLIAKRGVTSYFKQIIIDGFFHADPHPGNIIIMEDNIVCFIDEGMMGTLDDEFREDLAELVLLLISKNSDNLINQLIYMNILKESQNTHELKEDVNELLNKYYGAELKQTTGGLKDLLSVMMNHNVKLPREFVLIVRGITLIEETGQKLDPEFDTVQELKKLAKKIILKKMSPKTLGSDGLNYALEMKHLFKNFRGRLSNTLYQIEDGDITVNLKHDSVDRITNKLSFSLIISALIVGSSLAILSDKGPKLLDIPMLGLVGFVFSALLGIYVIFKFMGVTEN